MECPKCGGGCLLSEEDLVKLIEEHARDAIKAVIKGTYTCRACSEKFSRLFIEDLSKRKKPPELRFAPSVQAAVQEEKTEASDPAEGLKFF